MAAKMRKYTLISDHYNVQKLSNRNNEIKDNNHCNRVPIQTEMQTR